VYSTCMQLPEQEHSVMYSKVQKAEAGTIEYTEWQWPLSDVHSIMMVKSAQSGEGGGRLPPFTLSIPSRASSGGVRSS
jgi:hypothetical protein